MSDKNHPTYERFNEIHDKHLHETPPRPGWERVTGHHYPYWSNEAIPADVRYVPNMGQWRWTIWHPTKVYAEIASDYADTPDEGMQTATQRAQP